MVKYSEKTSNFLYHRYTYEKNSLFRVKMSEFSEEISIFLYYSQFIYEKMIECFEATPNFLYHSRSIYKKPYASEQEIVEFSLS